LTIPRLFQVFQDVSLLASKMPGTQTDLKRSKVNMNQKNRRILQRKTLLFLFSAGFEGILRTMVLIPILFYERNFT